MKNLLLFFLALSPFLLNAQSDEWLPGRALTDSSHYNRNACLYGQFGTNVLFWDQELDSASIQVCYKKLNSDPEVVNIAVSIPGVKLTNPKILDLNSNFSLNEAKVFYQTNEGNDIDLKYITYKSDGTITGPYALSSLTGDDINLTAGSTGLIAWVNSGKLWISQYLLESDSFSIPFAADSGGVYSAVSSNNLTYLKSDGDSTTIFSKYAHYYQGNWIIHDINSKSFVGKGSAMSSTVRTYMDGSVALQNKVENNPSGLLLFKDGLSDIGYRNSPTYNLSQPAILDYIMLIKSFGLDFLVYVSDSLSQNEIFAETPFSYSQGVQNISQWPEDDRNPQFFETWLAYNQIRIYLFWESERQGYSAIYYSDFDYNLYGNINDNPKDERIIVKPCPFDNQVTIKFKPCGKTNVSILDLQGREVKTLTPQKNPEGWVETNWDGTNNSGKSMPKGSYVIAVSSGNAAQNRIVIKK